MEQLQTYQENLGKYRRLLAQAKFEPALNALDMAISCCPVDEAIPTLSAMRQELEPKAKPRSIKGRLYALTGRTL